MSDSPYAPPKAAIAQIEPAEPEIPRPLVATRAVQYLWISFGIGALGQIADLFMPAADALSWELAVLFNLLFGAIFVWILLSIAKGRNWARIVNLVLTALSVLFAPVILYGVSAGQQTRLDAAVYLICIVIDCYACYLLLTRPASDWFSAVGEARS